MAFPINDPLERSL